ncbi:DUF883 family protein [Engelhardtia mirabilis]|uniref:DUF883 domain-containing protein n=1 Tax=Engelhardtia mirabilis TaxID=2528011 RepID=A0A518BQX2_9BACT|nr:hypothetical protein Pla133_45020 [Planctomycetes bacterium Pla133]QDV03709.1 hypothetical protein Pla86_45000 [Planctomycetes bacterium Pla86]
MSSRAKTFGSVTDQGSHASSPQSGAATAHSETDRTSEKGRSFEDDPTKDHQTEDHHRSRSEAAERLLHQAERVLAEIKALGTVAGESAGDAVHSAKQAGADAVQHGKENAVEARDQVADYVGREPLKALLMAAGVGVVLGMWSRR